MQGVNCLLWDLRRTRPNFKKRNDTEIESEVFWQAVSDGETLSIGFPIAQNTVFPTPPTSVTSRRRAVRVARHASWNEALRVFSARTAQRPHPPCQRRGQRWRSTDGSTSGSQTRSSQDDDSRLGNGTDSADASGRRRGSDNARVPPLILSARCHEAQNSASVVVHRRPASHTAGGRGSPDGGGSCAYRATYKAVGHDPPHGGTRGRDLRS